MQDVEFRPLQFVVYVEAETPTQKEPTVKFMLLFAANENEWMNMEPDQRDEAIRRIGQWFGEQAGAGHIVEGRRLQGKTTARTVRLGAAGRSRRAAVTDGPFVEAKEAIGSYAIVEATDMDGAIAIAASWPAGGAVEVRPVAE
jgi:hypothetical protein